MKKMNEKLQHPKWMKMDDRPMDRGRYGEYGVGYSRELGKQELWRPALRYFKRHDGKFAKYEEFRLTPGDYYVSDRGRIYSKYKGILLKTRKHKRKYTAIIDANGKRLNVRPYRLVLDNWIEPHYAVRHLLGSINHIDGKPWNDKLDNLEYTTISLNSSHARNVLHKGGRKKTTPKGKKRGNNG